LGVARRAVEVATEERRIVDAQVKAGNLAPVEATRVKAAVAQAELAVLDAENARAAANDVLASWVGDVGETFEPGNASGPTTSLSIDADRAVEAALSGNPGLNLARLQVDNAEMSLVASRHAMLPSLSLDARVGYSGFAQVTDGTRQDGAALSRDKLQTGDFPDRYVGATFTVPLGMRAERGAVGADIAEIGSAQSSLLSQENALALQVMGLVRTLETAQQRVALAELNLQLARETLAAEKARQQAGRAVQKDVLEAQRAVSDAEVQLLRARTDFEKALVELQALQGKL
jgi:outer membrane protein TolC